jgi:tmRNA-binding protein
LNIFEFQFELCVGQFARIVDALVHNEWQCRTCDTRQVYFQCDVVASNVELMRASFQRQMAQIHANSGHSSRHVRSMSTASLEIKSRRSLLINAVLRQEKIRRLKVNVDVQHFYLFDVVLHQEERTMFDIGVCRVRHLFDTRRVTRRRTCRCFRRVESLTLEGFVRRRTRNIRLVCLSLATSNTRSGVRSRQARQRRCPTALYLISNDCDTTLMR